MKIFLVLLMMISSTIPLLKEYKIKFFRSKVAIIISLIIIIIAGSFNIFFELKESKSRKIHERMGCHPLSA